uniref:sulfoquinovosidase-like n=1 Tax=Erigeron canadensis TaxID=72917 RepID=UPI001CB93B1C|nr:sulfoquinovosidase-like [Erigeron canadensis]
MSTLKITKKHNKHLNNPFPSTPKSLPYKKGHLFLNSQTTLLTHNIFTIGSNFQLHFTSENGGFFSICHKSQPTRSIWSTIPGQSFISTAMAETEVEESRGSFIIKDKNVKYICDHQTIDEINVLKNEKDIIFQGKDQEFESGYVENRPESPVVEIKGRIFCVRKNKKVSNEEKLEALENNVHSYAKYKLLFDQRNSNQIGFQVKLGNLNLGCSPKLSPRTYKGFVKKSSRTRRIRVRIWGSFLKRKRVVTDLSNEEENVVMKDGGNECFNRICLTYSSEKNERFFGFGEQFSHMDFKGRKVPIFVQEQGIGRGDQPITFAANLVSYRAGGDWSTTYAPSPFYMTSKMKSLYLEGYDYSVFDLTLDDRVQIQIHGDCIEGRILYGNSPSELIEQFTESIGRPPELPDWIISGAIVGMQGGTNKVRHVWEELVAHDVPISAFWLQDWVGERKTVIGSQLWWNWEVDETRYNGWKQLIKDLSTQHIKVMTYCNPCLAPMDTKPDAKKNLFEEAKRLDILVKDKNGEAYMVPNTAFDVGMLDLTHPNAANWFKKILQDMVDDGVRGWMADFGEGLPVDACIYSGEDPISAHNRYPEIWAQINREFTEEWKSTLVGKEKEDPSESLVFFMRAGFRNSPKWAMLFWEGDQMVSWQANDGIKSAVVGLLSSGLCGYAFNHSDIGGYCAVNLPFFKYKRDEELLIRWMELNAFTTIFRTHEGNKPSVNCQFYSNERTLSHFARFAKVYKAWKFYRVQLVKEASQKGLPVCRHLFLHYPNDDHVHNLTYEQFLVGDEILVVPTLDKQIKNVKAYFPVGESSAWKHIWTGDLYDLQGSEATIEAPVGYPAIFVKDGSVIGENFLKNLRDYKIL